MINAYECHPPAPVLNRLDKPVHMAWEKPWLPGLRLTFIIHWRFEVVLFTHVVFNLENRPDGLLGHHCSCSDKNKFQGWGGERCGQVHPDVVFLLVIHVSWSCGGPGPFMNTTLASVCFFHSYQSKNQARDHLTTQGRGKLRAPAYSLSKRFDLARGK